MQLLFKCSRLLTLLYEAMNPSEGFLQPPFKAICIVKYEIAAVFSWCSAGKLSIDLMADRVEARACK